VQPGGWFTAVMVSSRIARSRLEKIGPQLLCSDNILADCDISA
jgi:hypothetical protein